MINFHKYGFLDTKKLLRTIEGSHFWLCRYHPIWLFIWSDYYKPEIAFEQEFCFIRFLMPKIGICYYPPLGNGDMAKGIDRIKEDCRENGFDFNLAPVEENLLHSIEKLDIPLLENEKYASFIYSCEDLVSFKKSKEKKNSMKKFQHEHKKIFYRRAKKEDFPQILEFIEHWRETKNYDLSDELYYAKLNSIKLLVEHMYEFDLLSIILADEEEIYGIAMASIFDNMAYVHLNLALEDREGAKEELLSCLCKEARLYAKFINLEETLEISDLANRYMEYQPCKLEKFYSTFRL